MNDNDFRKSFVHVSEAGAKVIERIIKLRAERVAALHRLIAFRKMRIGRAATDQGSEPVAARMAGALSAGPAERE